MIISDEGLKLIKGFEGFHTRQPDGSCVAYLCPAGVPTIGHGLTEGVRLGMRMTAEEAEAALRKEIAKHEATVSRLVTVEINQNEFDALTSLSYNIGAAAFEKSSVLKRLNGGNRAGAAEAFSMWNKAGKKVLPGLVSRRAREASLFLKPIGASEVPNMPQRVQETPEPLSRKLVATGTAIVSSGVGVVTTTGSIPAPPPALIDTVSNVSAWKGLAGHSDPFVIVGVLIVAGIFGIPYLLDKWRDA
ncbi:MAG: lysozyme [Nitrospiraceae bacterium]|nr:lysozyme [Nitrospiraceae bacterium]